MLSIFSRLLLAATRIRRLEDGQGLTEYALIVALIVLVSVVGLSVSGGQISSQLATVASSV